MKKADYIFWGLFIFLLFLVALPKGGRISFPGPGRDQSDQEPSPEAEVRDRIQQEILMTKDPRLGYVPVERLEFARQQLIRFGSRKSQGTTSLGSPAPGNPGFTNLGGSGLSWAERGPSDIGGRCRAVLVDKNDATGNTVFVGSVSGGLWKSTSFSSPSPGWTQISSISPNLAITTLAQDPTNPAILYAGTGEGYFNIDALRGLGIYKSTDGGATWSLLSATTTGGANKYDFNYVQKVTVYSNGDVYASGISAFYCNAGGILRSTDGGATWSRVIGLYSGGGSCSNAVDFYGYDIEFSLNGDMYASVIDYSTGTPAGKIYKSPAGALAGNAGTWTNVTPAAGTGKYWQRIELALSATNNNLLYAIFQGTGNAIGAMERSSDGGSTWTNISYSGSWCDGGLPKGTDFSRGQAWYDLTLAVNPANDATLYAGGVDIMTSADSGKTWTQLTQWAAPACGSQSYVHADIHNITFLPGSSTNFIVGCDGGVFYTTDQGSSFSTKDNGLNVTQYYATAIHPGSGSDYMLAGAQDNGTHIFSTAGINQVNYATGGDGAFCFIDQNNASYQLTSTTNAQYYRSTDGGASFSNWYSSTNGRFINPADYDNTTQYLYCGYTNGVLRRIGTIVSGAPSRTSITVTANANLQVSAVRVDPNTTDSVWVALSTADNASSSQVPQLYVIGAASTGSRTLTQISSLGLSAGAYISSIDVERGNSSHLLVTVSNYGVASVWESRDKGTTWTSLDNNGVNLPDVPVRWGLIIPANANVGTGPNGGIMLATDLGVWSATSSAGTATLWTQNASGMGNVSTYMLGLRSADHLVAAATHGRGLFTTTLLSSPLAVSFVAFTGKAQQTRNHLDWEVQNEVYSRGFEIERSYSGTDDFRPIGFVPSLSAEGPAHTYTFEDQLVDLGRPTAVYRLKQVDLDGNARYSAMLALKRSISTAMAEYVWVSGNNLFIRLNRETPGDYIQAQILDMSGRMVMQRSIADQSQTIDISMLSRGTYVIRLVSSSGDQYARQFIKK